jgi:glucose/mannose-6-phosphate isomerase
VSDFENGLLLASPEDVKSELKKLKKVDKSNMLDYVIEMPDQIISATNAAVNFDEGDTPLDRNYIHMLGLGGSAVAGELLSDMLGSEKLVKIHRGIKPLREKSGLIISSYSGNTKEILDIAPSTLGGLRTVIFITSGGRLADIAFENSVPVWRIPENYQPRAAVGYSMALILALMEKWRIVSGKQKILVNAAQRLKESLSDGDFDDHVLVRAALSLATTLINKYTIVFHTQKCTGSGIRLAAQICENTKIPAFSVALPEALHNTVEGFANSNPSNWNLIFMSDQTDQTNMREAIQNAMVYFSNKGFNCVAYPATGDDPFELTLSRLFVADLVSLFLASKYKIDPTPLAAITDLKSMQRTDIDDEEEDDQTDIEEVED